jgi:hypothetical protein
MSAMDISPSNYYRVFSEVAAENADGLRDSWNATSPTTFTDFMFNQVLENVAKRLELCCFREYYSFDLFFYRERNTKFFPPGSTYAKRVSIALEHENVGRGSEIEIHKLQLLNVPLKVLISYPRDDRHNDQLLTDYAEIIAEADTFNDISTLRRQLVIFGFMREQRVTWEGFAYQDGAFSPVETPKHSTASAA